LGKCFGKAFFVNVDVVNIMMAVDGLRSATASKNYLWLYIAGDYFMCFKKRNWQEGDVQHTCYCCCICP
jgi:hypothetical protein